MIKRIKKVLKRLIQFIVVIGIITLGIIVYANWKIPHDAQEYIYKDLDSIPENSVALVLGTSRYIGNTPNSYFTNRIAAAKKLYDTGRISRFVVSGDNRHLNYNEPRDMTRALVEVGVPDSIIISDYAGFRTLDSVVRMGEVFGQKKFIIISQEFHNERAIYIARHNGMDAYGYSAEDLVLNRSSYRTKIREVFARVKVFIDLALKVEPKFLGDPIDIHETTNQIDSISDDTVNSKE